MSGAHPNIYESVSVFQEEENEASLGYYSALEGNPPPNSRRRKRIIDNQLLANYKNMLKNDEISLNTYVKYISTNFNFEKPKKSKKAEVFHMRETYFNILRCGRNLGRVQSFLSGVPVFLKWEIIV